MRYLLDSDWIIDGTSGISSAISTIEELREDGLAVSTAALGEIFEGAFVLDNPANGLAALRQFMEGFVRLEVTESIAERFAGIRYRLRRDGNLLPDLDLLIAATALEFDLILITRNIRHFRRVPGLRLYLTPPE